MAVCENQYIPNTLKNTIRLAYCIITILNINDKIPNYFELLNMYILCLAISTLPNKLLLQNVVNYLKNVLMLVRDHL